jgi:hypothetical protein
VVSAVFYTPVLLRKQAVQDNVGHARAVQGAEPGIKNEQQVKELWAYVSQFDTNGNVKK